MAVSSPRLLLLVALLWLAGSPASVHAQDATPDAVETIPAPVTTPDAAAAPAPVPAQATPSSTTLSPMRDTGCRPGDCPARELRAAEAEAPTTPAPPPFAAGTPGDRPAPGSIMHEGRDGQLRLQAPPPVRLPKLWPPIVLTSVGAALLVPSLVLFTVTLAEYDGGVGTVDGLGVVLVGAGLMGGGLIWLKRRKAKRRRILERENGYSTAWSPSDHAGPGLAFGIQGLGARVRLQM